MAKPIIVLGGGGHAKVVIDTLRLNNLEPLGYVDPVTPADGTGPLGVPYLGADDILKCHPPSDVLLVNGIGSLPGSKLRKDLSAELQTLDFTFLTIVHPSAVVGAEVMLGTGVQVLAGAVIQAQSTIGENVIVNTKASIDHGCQIGRDSHIAPGSVVCADVVVGEASHIGAGAVVIQSIRIGDNVVIGAGATIVKDVASGETVIP